MSMRLWNPYREMRTAEQYLNRLNQVKRTDVVYRPRTDVEESNDSFLVTMELPGVPKENIEISVEDDVVEVSALIKREEVSEETNESSPENKDEPQEVQEVEWKPRHIERVGRKFYRKFVLPVPVDPSEAETSLESGILTITLPKRAEARKVSLKLN